MRRFTLWICNLSMLYVFLCIPGCANAPDIPSPPLKQVFPLEVAGNKFETELKIKEKQTYTFGLSFLSRKSDPIGTKQVSKMTGSGGKNYLTGIYEDPGAPLSIRLKIDSVAETVVPFHFDQVISEVPKYAGGGAVYPDPDGELNAYFSFDIKIANVRLEPGLYRVSVEKCLAAPNTHGTPIYFHILRAYLGK